MPQKFAVAGRNKFIREAFLNQIEGMGWNPFILNTRNIFIQNGGVLFPIKGEAGFFYNSAEIMEGADIYLLPEEWVNGVKAFGFCKDKAIAKEQEKEDPGKEAFTPEQEERIRQIIREEKPHAAEYSSNDISPLFTFSPIETPIISPEEFVYSQRAGKQT